MSAAVPEIRIRCANQAPVRRRRRYVLYWMIGARRVGHNLALQRALEWCAELGCGLVVFEPLRVGYRWASDRFHGFVMDGMRDNARALAQTPVLYYPYVEPASDAGQGLLVALGKRARVVVTDDCPCFFLPRMIARAGAALDVRLECVDGNGLYPMRATERVFTTAASFRRHLQRELPAHLGVRPRARPLARKALAPVTLAGDIDRTVLRRWPPTELGRAASTASLLAQLPIDHEVGVTATRGGARAAGAALVRFIGENLDSYEDRRNDVEHPVQSHLSPYLHFGHISAHEVFTAVVSHEDWSPERLPEKPTGRRVDWWHMSRSAEAYLDQLITWRELGSNMCVNRPDDYDQYESLPSWALTTLAEHEDDPRPHCYTLEQFDLAKTHDPIWNAAQNQLRRCGVIHNYLRMLWGKKILEWSPNPRAALAVMIELNNKYALDGRDPNSYSGIFWTLGRYDRAWGPERSIFGKVRYMSSDSTRRKLRLAGYLARYAS